MKYRFRSVEGKLLKRALCSLAIMASSAVPVFAQLNTQDAKIWANKLNTDAIALINDNNAARAESKLAEAVRLDPYNANILNNYGLVLMKVGKLQEARSVLEKAGSIDPKFDAICLNMGLACEGLGDLVAARTYLARYIDIAKDRAHAEKMKDHVAALDKSLAKGAGAVQVDSDDYFGLIPQEKLHPWPKSRMPLKIFIGSGDGVDGFKPSYAGAFQRAFNSWLKALEGIASFQVVDTENGADITVRWTHDPKGAILKAEGGFCKYTFNGFGMTHADIQILTLDPSASDKLNEFRINWVSLHELGHALGLSVHSNNPVDVMFFSAPMRNTMFELSARDVATIRRLYTEKLPDTPLTLNAAGIQFINSGKYPEAEEKLNEALKLSPGLKESKQNLAVLHAKWSVDLINSGKYTEAETHLQKALELEQDPQLRDQNLNVLLRNYELLLKTVGRGSEVEGMYKKYDPNYKEKK